MGRGEIQWNILSIGILLRLFEEIKFAEYSKKNYVTVALLLITSLLRSFLGFCMDWDEAYN